jgi:hypothetical protein
MLIQCSEFVKRQTRTSEFSYYDGDFDEIVKKAVERFETHRRDGYRDGVVLVEVDPTGFYSALVPVTDDIEFEVVFEARREGENPYKKQIAYGKKQPATHVDIVLYRKDVLQESGEEFSGADWDIVSINARCFDEPAPIPPQTMARNQLANTEDGVGGTKADYSADEFAKSIVFWNTHTLIRERK